MVSDLIKQRIVRTVFDTSTGFLFPLAILGLTNVSIPLSQLVVGRSRPRFLIDNPNGLIKVLSHFTLSRHCLRRMGSIHCRVTRTSFASGC